MILDGHFPSFSSEMWICYVYFISWCVFALWSMKMHNPIKSTIVDHVLSLLCIPGSDGIKWEKYGMLAIELEKIKADNVQLYGKIRYVQDYSHEKIVSRGPKKV